MLAGMLVPYHVRCPWQACPQLWLRADLPCDSGRLSSMDCHRSVDDCAYWRDADEGRRDVEPLHCKDQLELWHMLSADNASVSESHHAQVYVTTALKADPDTEISSILVWQNVQHIVLTEAGLSMLS